MPDSELLKLTISEVAPLIQAREVSPVELTQAALDEAERRQPTLNSFITIMREPALAQARRGGGSPVPRRILGPTPRHPHRHQGQHRHGRDHHHAGHQVLRDHVPTKTPRSSAVARLPAPSSSAKKTWRSFAAGATSNNPHYGAVHNPGTSPTPRRLQRRWRRQRGRRRHFRVPGNRPGGSVRLPGAFCGVVGLKQTFGRVSQRGLLVTSFNGDHIGPMTRSVRGQRPGVAGHRRLRPPGSQHSSRSPWTNTPSSWSAASAASPWASRPITTTTTWIPRWSKPCAGHRRPGRAGRRHS